MKLKTDLAGCCFVLLDCVFSGYGPEFFQFLKLFFSIANLLCTRSDNPLFLCQYSSSFCPLLCNSVVLWQFPEGLLFINAMESSVQLPVQVNVTRTFPALRVLEMLFLNWDLKVQKEIWDRNRPCSDYLLFRLWLLYNSVHILKTSNISFPLVNLLHHRAIVAFLQISPTLVIFMFIIL